MKTKIYLLLMLLIPMLSMQAVTTTFYVNPASTAANDQNAGTDPTAPWISLNPTKWVEGCVVMLSPGVHSVLQTANVTVNVTLQGTSKNDVIIEGLSDDDIARGSESPRFFQVDGAVTLTLKDISVTNFITTAADMWGGMFNVSATSTLTLQNVNIDNAKLPNTGGAAIYSDGTLNLTNVSISNCKSPVGGAISIQGTGVATIENAIFKNNTTNDGLENWKLGGAIFIKSPTANVSINNSIFESNSAVVEGTLNHTVKWPVGGAIVLRIYSGYASKLHVTNTLFNKNFATFQGGAIEIHSNDPYDVPTNLDLYFANCTFIENRTNEANGFAIGCNSAPKSGIKGSFSLVNNTFMHNGPEVPTFPTTSVFLNNLGLTVNVINNLVREKVWNAEQQKFYGYGIAINANPAPNNNESLNYKGNVFDAMDGWWPEELAPLLYNSENFKTSEVAVDSVLTIPATGVPYLAISNENSIAVNKGINEYIFAGKNLVPSTDARGTAKYGASKDAGAYEFSPPTSIQNTINDATIFAYPNPFRDVISLNKEVANISIYDLAGKKRITAANVSKINVANLQTGLYVVCIVNPDGTVLTQKMQKY